MSRKQFPNGGGGPPIQWVITGRLRQDTINMIEFVAKKMRMDISQGVPVPALELKEVLITQMPWTGSVHQKHFIENLNLAVRTMAATIKALEGNPPVAIDGDSFGKLAEGIIRDVSQKIRHAPLGPSGQKMMRTEEDGAILVALPEEVKVEGQKEEEPTVSLSPELDAEADRAMRSGPGDDEDEEEGAAPRVLKPGEANPPKKGSKLIV